MVCNFVFIQECNYGYHINSTVNLCNCLDSAGTTDSIPTYPNKTE